MNTIKALIIGVSAMIFLGLTFELIFLFIDLSYTSLMKSYPLFVPYRQVFYYFVVAVGLFFVMFTGGFITSMIADKNKRLHTIMASIIVCSIALYSTSSTSELTLLSLVFIVLSIGFSLYGCRVRKKQNL